MPADQVTQDEVSNSGKLVPWIVKPYRRDGEGVIQSGLERLFALRPMAAWGKNADEAWSTAYVLTRLAELPGKMLSHSHLGEIRCSLEWLVQSQNGGIWNDRGKPDCLTTALAITALRAYGIDIPAAALNFLSRCRTTDGGFASSPDHQTEPDVITRLAITVTACRALQCVHPQTEEFLSRHVACALSLPGICDAGLYLCSEILDWPVGLASVNLEQKVSQLAQLEAESAYGHALLLRSLLHLRIPRAWKVAAQLRDLQSHDGSWRGDSSFEEQNLRPEAVLSRHPSQHVILASSVSALAMAETQPGPYFGPDLGLAKRL
jgi:hypothetical protein